MLPTILEVAIGAVLIFLTLSAICSSVAELISEALNLRSRYLEQGIITLLSDPDRLSQGVAAVVPASDLVAEVLQHPLLQKLGAAPPQNAIIRQIRTMTRTPEVNLPPQVPPALFASVMVDELRRRAPNYGTRLTGLRMRLKSLADSINNGMIGAAAPVPPVIFNAIDQRDARQALEEIRQALPLIADERVRVAVTNLVRSWEIEQIRQGVQSLPNSRTRDVLLTFVNDTDYKVQEIEHLQQHITSARVG